MLHPLIQQSILHFVSPRKGQSFILSDVSFLLLFLCGNMENKDKQKDVMKCTLSRDVCAINASGPLSFGSR